MIITIEYQKSLEKRLREKNPLLQILIGPRQVGKTTAAEAIFNQWSGPKIKATADSPTPPTAQWIQFHWAQARLKGNGALLILDEIQKINGWSEIVKLLFDQDRNKKDLRVLLLGSSSLFMQKGLTESLAGRFELIQASHWSYQEFKEAFSWSFDDYIRFGAYPGTVPLKGNEERWRAYIRNSIIEPVLGKDILGLQPVQNPALFRQTFELAVQYPAQVLSFQKMLGQLQDRGNTSTIKHYLTLMEQCFLLKLLQKYSGSTLQTRSSSPKIVVLNPALTHAYQSQERLEREPEWYGFLFESIVGMHLLKIPNSDVYYWREGQAEVDYIVKMPKKTVAIEIKSGMKKRKTSGIYKFSKRYPKIETVVWNFEDCLSFMEKGDGF